MIWRAFVAACFSTLFFFARTPLCIGNQRLVRMLSVRIDRGKLAERRRWQREAVGQPARGLGGRHDRLAGCRFVGLAGRCVHASLAQGHACASPDWSHGVCLSGWAPLRIYKFGQQEHPSRSQFEAIGLLILFCNAVSDRGALRKSPFLFARKASLCSFFGSFAGNFCMLVESTHAQQRSCRSAL